MRLAATIEWNGPVTALGPGVDPPRDGLSFRADGDKPKTLYVNGMEVGELATFPQVEAEWVREWGRPGPTERVALSTELECWLELPHVGDVP